MAASRYRHDRNDKAWILPGSHLSGWRSRDEAGQPRVIGFAYGPCIAIGHVALENYFAGTGVRIWF